MQINAGEMFENDVKMYGTQTTAVDKLIHFQFENDVKMYGTQTICHLPFFSPLFENDVKMYGTQTFMIFIFSIRRLRMM